MIGLAPSIQSHLQVLRPLEKGMTNLSLRLGFYICRTSSPPSRYTTYEHVKFVEQNDCANFTLIGTKLSYCIHVMCKQTRGRPIPLCNGDVRSHTCPHHVFAIRSFNRASACQPQSSIQAFAYAHNKLARYLTFMVSIHQMEATQRL